MTRPGPIASLAIVALACGAMACSFTMIEPLGPRREVGAPPECSASRELIKIDVAVAIAAAVFAGVGAIGEYRARHADEGELVILVNGRERGVAMHSAMAVLYGGSAIYGRWQRGRCERARDAHERWLAEHLGAAPATPR
jgi:hypothetical protein